MGRSDRPASVTNPRVAFFPPPIEEPGAYLALLRAAVTQAGVSCIPADVLTSGLARDARLRPDVVHLHWLELIVPSDRARGMGAAKTARRAARLLIRLRELRRRGVAVVWTVHNLAPHDPIHPVIERRLGRAVLDMADVAIVHSQYASDRVATRIGHRDKLVVIPHGNYIGAYPSPLRPVDELRAKYCLPRRGYVYLSFGQVRRYKRLPEMLQAFSALQDENSALIIAGAPVDEVEANRLRELAQRDSRVRLELRRIPDEEVAAIHSVADASVLAYADLFSSGSLLLSLSNGLPVIVPANSTATEIAAEPAAVAIGPGGLTQAMRAVSTGDQRRRRDSALAAAATYDWANVGRSTADVYMLAIEAAVRSRSSSRAG